MVALLELYYTPEILAQYFKNKDNTTQELLENVMKLYEHDYTYIHPVYKDNPKELRYKVLDYRDYLLDKEEYNENIQEVRNDYIEIGLELEEAHDHEVLDYFFINIRLERILWNRKSVTVKLRTLLRNYGYKRRSVKFLKHIEECLLFYHIQVYYKGETVDLGKISVDERITFKVMDFL